MKGLKPWRRIVVHPLPRGYNNKMTSETLHQGDEAVVQSRRNCNLRRTKNMIVLLPTGIYTPRGSKKARLFDEVTTAIRLLQSKESTIKITVATQRRPLASQA